MNHITFIGGGNMAGAIIGGLLRSGTSAPESLRVVEIDPAARVRIEQAYPGVHCSVTPHNAITDEAAIVLAVKPQQLRQALAALEIPVDRHLLISIAAGISLAQLESWRPGHTRAIRAMPNTPALVGAGITALFAGRGASASDRRRAEAILGAVGETVWIDTAPAGEDLMNAVTAVSGSGPAYVFFFMEAIQQAASELGLAPEVARKLVLQTFVGAARLVAESTEPVSVLRERVTSKGGTTEAALRALATAHVKDALVGAVKAADARGRELGEELGRTG